MIGKIELKRVILVSDRGSYVLEGRELELWKSIINEALVLYQIHFPLPREYVELVEKIGKKLGGGYGDG